MQLLNHFRVIKRIFSLHAVYCHLSLIQSALGARMLYSITCLNKGFVGFAIMVLLMSTEGLKK